MMTTRNKERLHLALQNAAELIRGSTEQGVEPEDVAEESEEGLYEYVKACERAFKMISTLAKKYRS